MPCLGGFSQNRLEMCYTLTAGMLQGQCFVADKLARATNNTHSITDKQMHYEVS